MYKSSINLVQRLKERDWPIVSWVLYVAFLVDRHKVGEFEVLGEFFRDPTVVDEIQNVFPSVQVEPFEELRRNAIWALGLVVL